jgi:mRNA export factor
MFPRHQQFPKMQAQVTCCAFNTDGTLYAYGVGYDWSKVGPQRRHASAGPHGAHHRGSGVQGHEHYQSTGFKGVFVHGVTEEEVKPKPVAGTARR